MSVANAQVETVPKLRFREFKDEWQIKKLKDLLSYTQPTKYIVRSTEYENSNKTPVLTAGKTFILGYTDETDGVFSDDLPVIIFDDFTTASQFVEFPFKVKSSAIKILKAKEGANIKIAHELLNRIKFVAEEHKRYWISEFQELKVLTPGKKEQEKIAGFLSAIDDKIFTLQNKRVSLQKYKKSTMEAIFSQEIRFKVADKRWEKAKLGTLGDFRTSSIDKISHTNEREVYLVNYMDVYRHKEISNRTKRNLAITTAKEQQVKSSNLRSGDILFTPSSETPSDIGHSVVVEDDMSDTVFSYHLVRFRPSSKIDRSFSHYFCNSTQVLNQFSRFAQGATRFTISLGSFKLIEASIPQSLDEQSKIADLLSSLDDKIDLTERQLDRTKLFKEALLQQMFV